MLLGNMNSLDVSLQLLSTTHGPVVSMEGRLHQRSHHASHRRFVPAAVALAIVLHAQPAPTRTDKQTFKNRDIEINPQTVLRQQVKSYYL